MNENKNKGFSLVELLIAVVIFSIVFASVASMMIFTSKSFVKANADAGIQKEAQLVVNQIGDMIIDSTGDMEFNNGSDVKELVIYGETTSDTYMKETVKWLKTDNTLKYSKNEATYDATTGTYVDGTAVAKDELLAENITDFFVDLSDVRRDTNEDGTVRTIIKSAKVSMKYKDEKDTVSYATTPIITLRNRMQMVGSAKQKEPPIVYELNVNVRVSNIKRYSINGKDGNLKVKCTGTVFQSGFDTGDLTYKWTVDKGYVSVDGDRNGNKENPDHCYFTILADAAEKHKGDKVTFTLTATPPTDKHKPVSGSDTMKVGTTGGDERGITFAPEVIFIPPKMDPPEGYGKYDTATIAYDFSYEIYDESGNIAKDRDYLIQNHLLEVIPYKDPQGNFQNFHLSRSKYLIPSRSYTVVATMKVRNYRAPVETKDYQIFTQTFIVPAVRIMSLEPECPWTGFQTVYGQAGTGDGIYYETEGFYGVDWAALQPYSLSLVGYESSKPLPEGYEILLHEDSSWKSNIAQQEGLDVYQSPFKLDLCKNGKVLNVKEINSNKDVKDLYLNYVDIKMTLEPGKINNTGNNDDQYAEPIEEVIRVRFTHSKNK